MQALKLDDKPCRFQFAKDILSNVEADENYPRKWIFSDDATFCVSGRVNRHDYRLLGSENPHAIREIGKDSAKVNVWCAFSCLEVLGSFIFAEQTVTGMTYLDMLPQLEDHQLDVEYQLDGAPPHWFRIVREFLDIFFSWVLGWGDTVRTLFKRPQ
jgi:hypothetical protein